MIKINGVDTIRFPSEYSVLISDLDDGDTTTRTMDGLLHRDRIATKRKINLKFSVLTWNELSNLLVQIKDMFFEVTYPDPMTGVLSTRTFYVGDRTSPVAKYGQDGTLYWKDIAFNFIER